MIRFFGGPLDGDKMPVHEPKDMPDEVFVRQRRPEFRYEFWNARGKFALSDSPPMTVHRYVLVDGEYQYQGEEK